MPSHSEDKPCRACTDFKSWAKQQNKKDFSKEGDGHANHKASTADSKKEVNPEPKGYLGCPLDKNELGSQTWGFLHTMVSYFPEKPTIAQSSDMTKFFNIFAQFYPCEVCSEDIIADIKKHPPKTKSRHELEQWLCERHNTVNVKIGKPIFDCSKVHERWREGWKDGSCD